MSVNYEARDRVALLTMDDGKANALSYPMMKALDEALDRAEKVASAVVLTGRAGRFSAGFDLKEMMAGVDQARALVSRGAEVLLRLYGLPMPLVIACSGHALAGGALMVATGDVRVAVKGPFKIGLNEVQLGMPVPILAMELARDRLAPSHLTAATLFAQVSDPEHALSVGWVDQVVEADALLPTAIEHANRLGQLPRDAYAKTKQSLRERMIGYVRSNLEMDMKRLTPPQS
jgi:enoyl-CoA hydratase